MVQKKIENFSEDSLVLCNFMVLANSDFVKGVIGLNEIMYDYDINMYIDLENQVNMLMDLQNAMKEDQKAQENKNKPPIPKSI